MAASCKANGQSMGRVQVGSGGGAKINGDASPGRDRRSLSGQEHDVSIEDAAGKQAEPRDKKQDGWS